MKKIIILFILLVSNLKAENGLQFNIDNADINKTNIIFEQPSNPIVDRIYNIIRNNLSTTNLFQFQMSGNIFTGIEYKDSISNSELIEMIIDKYRDSNTDAVLTSYIKNENENGDFELVIRFFDILDQRELFFQSYLINASDYKRTSIMIADKIYENLTNEISGHFDSKVLFVSETGTIKNRKKRIVIMDFDGSNLRYLTDGDNLVLTPIFSKFNRNELVYLEYVNKFPNLFKLNLLNRTKQKIGKDNEMTFAPNFHPNGVNEMLYSVSKSGHTNIYKINFDTNRVTRLTDLNAINTSPSYSPDGEQIVFVSDKSGSRRLYVMDSNGKNTKQISRGNIGEYDKPSWSPDGRLISFVKIERGNFYIGLMTPDGENERLPVSAYLIDGIRWSPNGRYLIYSKQSNAFGSSSIPHLYIFDILTNHEFKLNTPSDQGASDPDWIMKDQIFYQ
ncbi:MAG: DUF5050 domain-containing protein [Rickettsiales bacterium]|jgi:TolB protein|nr:DUF5050 domain-containing protein [Rickettsiales bacterium]